MGSGWTGPAAVIAAVMAGCVEGGGAPEPRSDASPGARREDASSAAPGDAGPGAMECVHSGPPVLDPARFPPCPSCGGGRCLPAALVPEDERDRLADCDAMNKCVPDLFIETGGAFLLASCRSVGDVEGRCASICIPDIAEQLDLLPQSTCGDGERCAPCFRPTTGEETGVCSLSCDPGPSEPPASFASCCGGAGSCVPASAVPEERRADLEEESCPAGMGLLCAPSVLTDPAARPAPCRSTGDGEGRCLPACLPSLAERSRFLPVDACAEGELCAPCFDPLTGEDSGACRIHGDAPVEPPLVFPRCCEEEHVPHGTCIPREVLPPDRRESLREDSCHRSDGDDLCVPDELVDDPDHVFASCRTEGLVGAGEPGACVPKCVLGPVALFLGRSSCRSWEKCAPCTDPLSGEPTGACR